MTTYSWKTCVPFLSHVTSQNSYFSRSQIISAISFHFGESLVRARFTDYVWRFVRLAARYDEEINGSTRLGWQTSTFVDWGDRPRLGSGLPFFDDPGVVRELQANASRIEGWRQTKMCTYWEPVRFAPPLVFVS